MNLSKEQLKMHRKEIQAWADGKQIQYRIDDDCEWKDENDPAFFTDCEYRVKPNPVLIPFDYSDAEFLLGKSVKSVDGTLMAMVHAVGEASGVRTGYITYSYEDFLKTFTFFDGTPCGKPDL